MMRRVLWIAAILRAGTCRRQCSRRRAELSVAIQVSFSVPALGCVSSTLHKGGCELMKHCKLLLAGLLILLPAVAAAGDRDRHRHDHHDHRDCRDHRHDHILLDGVRYGYSPYLYHRYGGIGHHEVRYYAAPRPRTDLSRYMLPQHRSNRVIIVAPHHHVLHY